MSTEGLADLRHDLRTPINHILGYSEMLIEDARDLGPAEIVPDLEKIHAAGSELLALINDGLSATKEAITPEEKAALCESLQPGANQIVEATARVQTHPIDGDHETLAGDLEKIASAARKLLQLAGEKLLGRAGGVSPPSEAPAPNEPADTSCAPETRGANTPRSPETNASRSPDDRTERLLVVDDNEGNRDMLSRQLVRQGHLVSVAENGRQALDMLRTGAFDLVLLDIMMPELDGYQVLAALKGESWGRDLPVIMISALDEIQSVVRCIEMGAEDYLPKPFDPVLLRARIGACLEKKRLRDQERKKTKELEEALRQLRATQDQLIVQEKLASLGALTAGIAHEIKNPLNFVTNFAQLSIDLVKELRETLEPVMPKADAAVADDVVDILTNLEEDVAKIDEHGRRADSIVRGMLLHSRGQTGERQPTDVNGGIL